VKQLSAAALGHSRCFARSSWPVDHPDRMMLRGPPAASLRAMDDYGWKFWLKVAGLFVLGAIALFVVMWIFLSVVYAWSFLGALLVLALVALAFGWVHDRRNAGQQEGSS
jgi:predicted lysophospholipase L1 biosynthesis ABC-type transport system permease subunit